MICRTHRFQRWFGLVAAVLLLALPVQADDIEPEPYVEEAALEPESEPEPEVEAEKEAKTETAATAASNGPSIGSKIFDCVILRPFGLATTIIGGVFFVPAAALASPSGADNIQTAWEHFVLTPVENTFQRPLGEF
jgi:hypothetical protein